MIVLEVAAWVAIATMAVLLATQVLGWSGSRLIVGLQALSLYVLALSLPIAAAAIATRRWPLAVAACVAMVALVVMCVPLRGPSVRSAPPAGSPPLRIFHANLLYLNGRTAELARVVAALDADLLAFTEYTPVHAGGMYVSPLAPSFPFRIEHPEASAGGSALWSRFPLTEIPAPPALYQSTAALVDIAGGLQLYVVHPPNPLDHLGHWLTELNGLAALYGSRERPAIVTGDLNATNWHPPFRRALAAGWRDAHHIAGRALTNSWPDDKAWLPPIMRLDHALVDDSVMVTDVVDVGLPGSDHRGFVVTVALSSTGPARRAGRSQSPQEGTDGSRAAWSRRRGLFGRTPSPGSTVGSPSPPPAR